MIDSISKQAKKFVKKEMAGMLDTIVLKVGCAYEDTVFIRDGFWSLVQVPSKLKWTYCISYFLEQSRNYDISFSILSNLQGEISSEVSQLRNVLVTQVYKHFAKEKEVNAQKEKERLWEKKTLIQAKIRVVNEYLLKLLWLIESEEYANESVYSHYCFS